MHAAAAPVPQLPCPLGSHACPFTKGEAVSSPGSPSQDLAVTVSPAPSFWFTVYCLASLELSLFTGSLH